MHHTSGRLVITPAGVVKVLVFGLARVTEGSAEIDPGNEATHRWPRFCQGGRAVLFTASRGQTNFENATVEVLSLKTGQRKTLIHSGFFGRYLPDGHLTENGSHLLLQDTG
ncbi:MAG TPA: hypothetical protein VFB14_22225 [Bryobacteraceae bacterium]|nr:hypothetical protein [Bryobacteraceae bacterium]